MWRVRQDHAASGPSGTRRDRGTGQPGRLDAGRDHLGLRCRIPGGLTLELRAGPGLPTVQAAGRFLAPAGGYFPDLLDTPADEAGLVGAALAEIGRGAACLRWYRPSG